MRAYKEEIVKQNSSFLKFYISPWDTEIFKYKVVNINTIVLDKNEDLKYLLSELDIFCKNEDVKVIVCKVDSADEMLINSLQNHEYKYIEMSVVPYINPQNINEKQFKEWCNYPIRRAEGKDLNRLKEIARVSFKNDRFHKDVNFSNVQADERYSMWVENSFNDGEDIFVISCENSIAGFFILKTFSEQKYAEMRLGCIDPEFQGKKLGLNINAEIVLMLREQDILLLDSPISIANLGIFNLYISMGFKFKEQKVCFHKWL